MNKLRRQKLVELIKQAQVLYDNINNINIEEDLALDSIPENMQSSERAEQMEANLELFEDALEHINNAIATLKEIE